MKPAASVVWPWIHPLVLALGAAGCPSSDPDPDATGSGTPTGPDDTGTGADTTSGSGSSGDPDGSGSSAEPSGTGGASTSGDSAGPGTTGDPTGHTSAGTGDTASGTGDGTGGSDTVPDPLPHPALVVYWGQNGWGGAHLDQEDRWEQSLAETCANNPHYDAIVLGFVIDFASPLNEDSLPHLNFSFHCEDPYDDANPVLLRCPQIEAGIEACHALGKHVLISLGGASGAYGFESDAEARTFARTTWDMFMGGTHAYRPFGPAVIDGVDLDIEGGGTVGYTSYVQELRRIIDTEGGGRAYSIAAAPQCPYPDAYLGSTFDEAADAFDFVMVQFYNNYCHYGPSGSFNFEQWAGLGPEILVGLPAAAQAGGGFVPPGDLPSLLGPISSDPAYGGVMLWDASYDQNSGTPTYGQSVADLL